MLPLRGLWWHNVVAGTPHSVVREQWMAMDDQSSTVGDNHDVTTLEALSNLVHDTTLGPAHPVLVNPYGGCSIGWSALVKQLQEAVPTIARGVGVVGAGDGAPLPAPFYADYDFFASRRDLNAL